MKTRNKKLLYLAFLVLGMLLLSGCTANLITDIKADGSGTFTEEFIMTVDELASYEMEPTDTLCSEDLGFDLSTMPPGATVRQEQNGDEITCIFEVAFGSL